MAAMQDSLPNGGFGVSQGNQQPSGPAVLPTPGSMPISQQETPIVKNNVQASSSGGKSDGGGILGGLGGLIGKGIGAIFGGLFAEGGFVGGDQFAGDRRNGFAEGGTINNKRDIEEKHSQPFTFSKENYGSPGSAFDTNQQEERSFRQQLQDSTFPQNEIYPWKKSEESSQGQQNPYHDALALGYLIGAYHTQHYGGTPETFPKAAEEFKQIMSNQGGAPQGSEQMASGGMVNSQGEDPNQAQTAMDQTLGNNMPSGMPTANGSQGFANAMPQPQAPMRPPSVMAPMQPSKGFASGGPPMMPPGAGPSGSGGMPSQGQPPLQPGETFQGDGSVKGPGGPTDDVIPAKLSNGEFVMSAAATQFFGVDKLVQMNQKGKEGFMQAVHQVDANQQPPQGGPPGMPPGGAPPQGQPPMMGMMQKPSLQSQMKSGGPAMRPKSSGYMGV